jgi:glutamate synthase (NADPH) small chain
MMNNDRDAAWRVELRTKMKNKDRLSIERVKMPAQDPHVRAHNHLEVNLGLTPEAAMREASRCLDCPDPTCITGCPVSINIPHFVKRIEAGEFVEAAQVLKDKSSLPAVCGRVCPQEKQCEAQCIYTLKLKKTPVAIGHLERFAADYEREQNIVNIPEMAPSNGRKIAVIGSGPSSLAFAGEMAKYGYTVVVFEALHEIGGVLKYGIPEFRLPNTVVDAELEMLRKMKVEFITNCVVGRTITIEELRADGYEGIYVASGAGLPRFMNIPGENLNGVLSANEYLTRVNLMGASRGDGDTPVLPGKHVAIIGGGNTAMDSVRTALRLGAERAMIVYRRRLEEMPARVEEVEHALEEGVEFLTLHNPVEYIGTEKGKVKAMVLQKMQLGEPDSSGRRSPVPIEGAFETIPVDLVIVSVGVSPNPLIPASVKGLDVSKWGTIIIDAESGQTSIPFIYAGGDIVRGGATVIHAMGDGKKAAKAMNEYLNKEVYEAVK